MKLELVNEDDDIKLGDTVWFRNFNKQIVEGEVEGVSTYETATGKSISYSVKGYGNVGPEYISKSKNGAIDKVLDMYNKQMTDTLERVKAVEAQKT